MKKNVIGKGLAFIAASLLVSTFTLSSAHSALISVAGGTSTVGVLPSIIAAPGLATDPAVTNWAQEGFDEKQGVLLGAPIAHDGGIIAAGTRVDSHMIFLNIPTGGVSPVYHNAVTWTFSGTILGVMSDGGGTLEAATTALLGAIGTAYTAPYGARGMEGLDTYSIVGGGFSLLVDMGVSQPGDWIRVVTLSVVPLPAALPLYGAGLALMGFLGWRKKKAAA